MSDTAAKPVTASHAAAHMTSRLPHMSANFALALGLLAALPCAWAAESTPSTASVTDCADARRLPPEADEESRRITCEIPDKYREDVSRAQFMGALLRQHDIAAWLTTDALLANGAFKRMPGEGQGWLTLQDPMGGDVEVRYYTRLDGKTFAVAAARLDAKSVKAVDARRLSPPAPTSDREDRLMKAKAHALESRVGLCTPHPANTVVLEANDDGREEILVFVMSAWKDPAQSPLGGYHMFRYSPDGETQLDHYSQTRSCPMADLEHLTKDASELSALAVTHLTSATPTMFHVFMSLQYRKPLFVMTGQNGLSWSVEQGRIRLLESSAGPEDNSGTQPAAATSPPAG